MEHVHKKSGFKTLVCVQSATEQLLIRHTLQDINSEMSISEAAGIDPEILDMEFQLLILDEECLRQAQEEFDDDALMAWMQNRVEMTVFLLDGVTHPYDGKVSEIGRHACVVKPYTQTVFQNALAAAFPAA